ncbi:MAG: hypothetical protein Q8K92_04010 [Leadbetterella sp.]|nr:hypothetical protein [Leadbetterella sp.]
MKKILFFFCIVHVAVFGQDAILKNNENQIFSLTSLQMQNSKMLVADKNQDLSWNLIQGGNQNSISFKMSAENSFAFIQKGEGNHIEMMLLGENNIFKLEQLGNQNMLQLREVMFSNGMLEVRQEGNGNVLLESGIGLGIPMKIEQRGGMRIEINSRINGFQ